MRTNIILGAALLASVAVTANAGPNPNLVTNGGFENVTGGPGRSHEFGASYKYGQTVDNWTSSSTTAFNLIFYPGQANGPDADTRFDPSHPGGETGQYLWNSTLSPNGGKFVALDGATGRNDLNPIPGNGSGPLEQTINNLMVGGTYTVSFYYAGAQYRDRMGNTMDKLYTTFGGVQMDTGAFATPSMGFTGWKRKSYVFTANATSELLSFLSVGTPGGLPPVILLDGVSVTPGNSIGVPEPAMLGLLGLGLAGVAGMARLRRR